MPENNILQTKVPKLQDTIKEKITNKLLVEKLSTIDLNKKFNNFIKNISENFHNMIEEARVFNLNINLVEDIFDFENNKEEKGQKNSFTFSLNDNNDTSIKLDIYQMLMKSSTNNELEPIIECYLNVHNHTDEDITINKKFSIEESVFFIKEYIADKIMQSESLKY